MVCKHPHPYHQGVTLVIILWAVKINSKYQPSGKGGTRSPHATPATPHRLQRRTACQWAPKWPTGSGKLSTPRFWGAPVNFC